MKKPFAALISPSLMAAGAVLASSTFSPADAASLSFTLDEFTGNDAQVKLSLDDAIAGSGKVQFTVDVVSPIADIRGVFFNILDDSLLNGLTIIGSDITQVKKDAGNVINLGNGNNLNGGGTPGPFDAGLEIGTSGIGKDDIHSTKFIVSHSNFALTVDQFAKQKFGVRLTSVGTENNRNGSSKLGGTAPDVVKNGDPTSVPEPGTTAALGLFALSSFGLLKKNKKEESQS